MLVNTHTHSTYSDGIFSYTLLLNKLYKNHTDFLALTDHDTINGSILFKELSLQYNLHCINGIELTTDYKKTHILGYNLQDISLITDVTNSIRKYNEETCKYIVSSMAKDGISIDFNKVLKNSFDAIIDKKAINRTLLNEGITNSISEGFEKYIGRNAKYYIKMKKLKLYDTINLIHDCGGMAILAHPFRNGLNTNNEIKDFIVNLIEHGLDGIELIYPSHSIDEINFLFELVKKYSLIISAGSDLHNNTSEINVYLDPIYKEFFIFKNL